MSPKAPFGSKNFKMEKQLNHHGCLAQPKAQEGKVPQHGDHLHGMGLA